MKTSLKALRVNAGMTGAELGEELGVTLTTVSNWERGCTAPKLKQVQAICELFDVKFEEVRW